MLELELCSMIDQSPFRACSAPSGLGVLGASPHGEAPKRALDLTMDRWMDECMCSNLSSRKFEVVSLRTNAW
jgi:hypothetical protein